MHKIKAKLKDTLKSHSIDLNELQQKYQNIYFSRLYKLVQSDNIHILFFIKWLSYSRSKIYSLHYPILITAFDSWLVE